MNFGGGGFGGGGGLRFPSTTSTPFSGPAAPATTGFGGGGGGFGGGQTLSTGNFPGAMGGGAVQQDNIQVTGETNFSQLPHTLQQKIWEIHRLVLEHRRHAEAVSKFSTQDYGLDQHTKKLKLDILRVQNSHSEISLAAGELRRQVERLRSYIHKVQSAETGMLQYTTPRASLELWQQQGDSHAEILREMVGQFERRLVEYDSHIQELYRKVVHGRAGGDALSFKADASRIQIPPDQLAALIRLQNDALLKVAAQVAGVHDMVERLRSEWSARTGQDPFEELDRITAEEEERKRRAARLVVPSALDMNTQNIFQLGNQPSSSSSPLMMPGQAFGGSTTPSPFSGSAGRGFGNSTTNTAGGAGGFFGQANSTSGGINLFSSQQQQQQPPSTQWGTDSLAPTRAARSKRPTRAGR